MIYCEKKKGGLRVKDKKPFLRLFLTFLKIGAFTFGGGYAMIPLIEREVCEKREWLKKEELLDVVAVAESTPGPIAINAATFVGYRTGGFFGALLATFGVVSPAFLVITLVSFLLTRFGDLRLVKYAFRGVQAGVLALIVKALVAMYKQSPKGVFSYVLMGAVFVLSAAGVPVVWVILGSALAGLLYTLILTRRAKR